MILLDPTKIERPYLEDISKLINLARDNDITIIFITDHIMDKLLQSYKKFTWGD